jgi:hypothetical protein
MLAHFLGAIVIELRSADPGRVKVFSVIDGQQRLTTLQVLLASLRAVAQERDESRVSDLERMLRNEGRHADGPLGPCSPRSQSHMSGTKLSHMSGIPVSHERDAANFQTDPLPLHAR